MLDPSLVLYSYTTDEARDSVRASSERVFLPRTFADLVAAEEFEHPVFRRLAPGAHMSPRPIKDRTRWILDEELVVPWDASEASLDRDLQLADLETLVSDPLLRSILSEEWAFLQSESWLASKTRKPFDAFIRAGAVAIELNREVFDKLAARTLKIPRHSH
jgi:hypothetical protein